MTLETCDESDEETWPDHQKDNDKDNYNDKDKENDKDIQRMPSKTDPRDLWRLRRLIREMRRHDLTNKKTMTITNMEETWHDQQKENDKDKDNDNGKENDKDI